MESEFAFSAISLKSLSNFSALAEISSRTFEISEALTPSARRSVFISFNPLLKSNKALVPAIIAAPPVNNAPIGVKAKAIDDLTKPPIPEVIAPIPSFAPCKSPEANESQIPVSVPRKPPDISFDSFMVLFVNPSSSRYSDCR